MLYQNEVKSLKQQNNWPTMVMIWEKTLTYYSKYNNNNKINNNRLASSVQTSQGYALRNIFEFPTKERKCFQIGSLVSVQDVSILVLNSGIKLAKYRCPLKKEVRDNE